MRIVGHQAENQSPEGNVTLAGMRMVVVMSRIFEFGSPIAMSRILAVRAT